MSVSLHVILHAVMSVQRPRSHLSLIAQAVLPRRWGCKWSACVHVYWSRYQLENINGSNPSLSLSLSLNSTLTPTRGYWPGTGIISVKPMGGLAIATPFIFGVVCLIGWLIMRTVAKQRLLLESEPARKELQQRNHVMGNSVRDYVRGTERANGTGTSPAVLPVAKILPSPHTEGLNA